MQSLPTTFSYKSLRPTSLQTYKFFHLVRLPPPKTFTSPLFLPLSETRLLRGLLPHIISSEPSKQTPLQVTPGIPIHLKTSTD